MTANPDNWERVKALFDEALGCDPVRRTSFVEENASDQVIRDEVMRLLAEHDEAGSFLSSPAFNAFQIHERHKERLVPGQVLAGRFRISRFIAAGGMGEVYEAEDIELRESVAIKCIRDADFAQPNALVRFRREVHLARRVTHPNVCRIFDLFRHNSDPENPSSAFAFVSMELLRGETLLFRLHQKGRFTSEEALPLITQIAEGLSAAHRAGIVHRDFKPGNVILVPDPESTGDRVVITDFGLALRADGDSVHSTDVTASRSLMGTPAYMAPEQLDGGQITPATDIYALGLVIYEMVTGVRPFAADSPIASAAKRLSAAPQPPRQLVPQLSDVWEDTIIRCLQRDPNARYSSALRVAEALSDQETGVKVHGFRRRSRLKQIGMELALLLAVVGAAYHFRGWMSKGRTAPVHAATRPTVAVLGFRNLSGKPEVAWISPAMSQMLGTELAAGQQLRTIPSEQVTRGKIDLALADENSLGQDTLGRVRSNMGTDFVVLGSFLDMDGQIRLDLTLQNAVAGETIATISESGPERDLPELAVRAGSRLRHKLGVADPAADDVASTRAAQSASLDAMRFYSRGLEKLHSYDSLAAKDLLIRAVAADPSFALAHSALAEAWRSLGYGDKSATEAKKAFDLSHGLVREDRLAIEAQYQNSIHNLVREGEIYKSLFDLYPDNLEYGLSLAKSQYFNAQYQDANFTLDILQQLPPPQGDDPRIDHIRSAVAVATGDLKKAQVLAERVELRAQQRGARRLNAQALANECGLLSRLGEPTRAGAACDRSRTIFSEIGESAGEAGVWGQIAFQATNRGDNDTARSANERQVALLKKIEYDGGLGFAMTVAGEISSNLGDYQRALPEYKEALRLYQKVGYKSGAISSYGNIGWVNSLEGNLAIAVSNYNQAITLIRQANSRGELDLWLGQLAEAYLDQGDVRNATKQLEEAFKANSETGDKRVAIYLHTARSKLLLATGELDESRREAELAVRSCIEVNDEEGANDRRVLLARVDIAQERAQAAVEALRKTVSNSKTRQDSDRQIEARALLIQALLVMLSDDTKREIAQLARLAPITQNVALRLEANLQIARAQFALGRKAPVSELLRGIILQSQRSGYTMLLLDAELTNAEIDARDSPTARAEIERIAKQAEAKRLTLIAKRAHSLL